MLFRKSTFAISLLVAQLIFQAGGNFAYANVIAAETAKQQADLGWAFRSDKEDFVGQACIQEGDGNGKAKTSGPSQSGFTFSQSLSEAQAASELGFGMDGRASYGVSDYSIAADFYQQSVSSSFSISSIWESECPAFLLARLLTRSFNV
jgi:hypothetical protein